METATFGAGCFWGVEEVFRALPGVLKTRVGYIGGKTERPTYQQVCTDTTGHAEAVEITFDPTVVTYKELVDVFFEHHNPTTLNRQGPDIGAQYRSAIFYHSPEQQKTAKEATQHLEELKKWDRPIVTTIEPATTFWEAEEYHQQYLAKRGQSSCHL